MKELGGYAMPRRLFQQCIVVRAKEWVCELAPSKA